MVLNFTTVNEKPLFKGNTQFLLLCNPQKSGASRVCIIFPQITQKTPTKDNSLAELLSLLQRSISTMLLYNNIWYKV